MVNTEDCPSFEILDADVKVARQAKHVSRRTIAEKISTDWRYLVNVENGGIIPSLPVAIQPIKACGLPVEHYLDPEIMREESELRQRASHEPKPCFEEYLPTTEGAIGNAILIEKPKKNETEDV